MMREGIVRAAATVAAVALVLAPPAAQAAAAVCPDPATVQAARIVEFQTMMMGVSVRCKHVGVGISDHLDEMNTARRTMLTGANDRVAQFLRSLNTRPAAGAATAFAVPAPSAPPPSAAPGPKSAAGKTPAGKAPVGKAPAGKAPAAAKTAAAAAPAAAKTVAKPAAKPAGKVSRRTDPFERYLTMIGNQYGGGITTLQRCKAFDAIVVSLADKTNTDRLMTMVSSSLVQVTLLEAIVNCPPGKE